MDILFLWKGVALGFSIAAPVGPIGVLCIRRTLADGRIVGLVTGLGAATADAFYGGVAGFGLSLVTGLLVSGQNGLRGIGGLFLCYLGIKTFLAKPAEQAAGAKARGLGSAFASTFFLTLTNPMTILSFAAMFAGLGAVGKGKSGATMTLLVLGVFLGSALWWLFLSAAVGVWRARIDRRRLEWVNRLSGGVIFGFGLLSLALALRALGMVHVR